ncbi:hypothetical protein IE53DRAFT_412194 [Violaceomyces palustris]|uniref:Uncharacterized protein n=1 Tax=Violaceomyces palustris TaxID=1673888 RepID=A0ACD0NRZ6_9BASI|nr:hypothetical protein IE53DRAFT_412194 [Violaceomyces palustris]
MMKQLTDQAQGFLGTSKPFSAVTDWIDRLCTQKYAEDDFDGIPELVEAINLQSTGPTEASRAIRKKLKYANIHGQKRSLIILKALVENCGPRFQTSFANDMLVERIKLMSQDELVDASVRKLLMRVLLSWHQQFKDDPSMKVVSGLYAACGGGKKSDAQKKSEAAEAFRKQQEKARIEAQMRADRKAAERLQKQEEKDFKAREKERLRKGGSAAKRPAFNFEQEKPQILNALATSQQSATALVNALQHVNREKESVTTNPRVQEYLAKVKTERKKIIRYIQLVKDEEFVGGLISANDQVILALQLYDKLSKPADLDSDDEEPLAAISATASEKAAARIEADDKEIELVRQRIAAARLNAPDGELEKLQNRQRGRIERHNSRAQSIRSFDFNANSSGGGGQGAGVMGDLMDLNFDDQPGSGAGGGVMPGQRGGADGRMTTSNDATSTGSFNHGTLSDYSDYDESDESDENGNNTRSKPRGSHHSRSASGAGGKRSSHQQLDESDDEEWRRATQSHQPKIGPGFDWRSDEEDGEDNNFGTSFGSAVMMGGSGVRVRDDDEEDPFADPFADGGSVPKPSKADGWGIERPQNPARKEWAAI